MDSSNPETAAAAAVVVVGPQYCAPNPAGLVISTQRMSLNDRYDVRDSDGSLMFEIKPLVFHIGNTKIMKDAAGNPILTLRDKVWSFHSEWKAFRGKSTDKKDLIFSVRKSAVFMRRGKLKLKVYLASNSDKEVCDFNVEEKGSDRPCSVYAGESNSDVVAQMHKSFKAGWIEIKEKYAVAVYPNVDQLFIAALFVILREINAD